MKRAQIILSLILLTVLSAPIVPVKADTTAGTQKSTFSMDIAADSTPIIITSVPTFTFAQQKAFDLKTQSLPNIPLATGTTDSHTLTVTDYSGSGQGWQLTAAMNPFYEASDTNKTGEALDGTLNLHWDPTAITTDNPDTKTYALPAADSKPSSTDSAFALPTTGNTKQFWDTTITDPNQIGVKLGQGINTLTFADNTTLALTQNSAVRPTAYKATITWTLSNTPTN
ncbi:WxL domain-containing protein [Lacticaseibacillus saniviri]|uniref:WxL domain-containing protein n=2 Tax=Lacticaseibacillus saniviri TaxID=931533 RepID=A0A0R2MTR8_9LACO|nr:WxL domain-containing protein [Lacticaseibacillus saniviri]KRO16900.1 hypothetical protein IV56_GL000587 [Lacticaseibacillus saniviri JCM 17471 = DSM 24301]MCG4282283.1 WxL domain-containing protein [Lacticaseibacillus saniviri]